MHIKKFLKSLIRFIINLLTQNYFFITFFKYNFFILLMSYMNLKKKLVKHGLRPINIAKVNIEDLNFLRNVKCETIKTKDLSFIYFLEYFFEKNNNWSIRKSMHFFLYDKYVNNSMPDNFEDLDYYQWHKSLSNEGINHRPHKWIIEKINSSIHIIDSIKKKGFQDYNLDNLPIVLKNPLISTRYNINHKINGYEIFDGHHRCSALLALGFKDVKVLFCEDVSKKTPFGIDLSELENNIEFK